jgi:Flp pilus assembly protein TadG
MIEFVCVLPFLLLVLTGIIDYSFMLYDTSVIANAGREGARYGIVRGTSSYATTASVIAYTETFTTNLISFSAKPPSVTVTATSSVSPPTSGATLTVTVTYAYTDLMLHYFMGTTGLDNLTATTVMVYE